ncbi:uncharacterized protein LOC129728472 [Wyeomyia smithii]|uniref:uncharacterized protein LOC129728472 n=1 Tax=Wyeomyia smithii TaxID=174621 RepID=UPI0024681334|nr:uncharacterized protein LOC129728472 [Wyeomyia smithii]
MAFILRRSREESKRVLTRADGWALRLTPYSYEIEYIRGHDNIADPSSRLYSGEDDAFNEEVSPWEVCHLEPYNSEFLTEDEIRKCTERDSTLTQVVQAMETNTWPKSLMKFKSIGDDLIFTGGIFMKNGCAVIPLELREKTLEIAHLGHPLEAKLKSILRRRVWWPGMATDAEKWLKSCAICSVNGRPEKPPPMQRLFAPKGQNGLVEGFMKIVNKAMSAAISSGASYQKELYAAVQSYNAADHSITKLPPEEMMTGRKIRRGLPLLNYGKSGYNEQLLDERDREAKLLSIKRED